MTEPLDIYDLAERVKSVISQPKLRDKQVKIGPSGIGSECGYCVARTMAVKLHGTAPPTNRFSLYPWVGTAVHFYLEHLMGKDTEYKYGLELDGYVGEIEGYGKIKGQIDLYSEAHAAVIDYKLLGKASRTKYVKHGLSSQYFYQSQMYGLAIERMGLPIKDVGVLAIPRDSASLADIKLIPSPYDRDAALSALRRAERIYQEFVIPNKIHELDTSDDCFNSHMPSDMQINIPERNALV